MFVGAALVFGGATHGEAMSSAVVRLAALVVLGPAVWILLQEGVRPGARWPTAVLALAVLLAVIQLIPLPPQLWTHLPQRASVVEVMQISGTKLPWLPISLAPSATLDALLSLAPPAAAFLAGLSLDERGRRRTTLVVIAAALLGAVLSAGQLASGEDSGLRFYSITNADSAVGFFANRNHYASLLVIALPMVAYWLAHSEGRARGQRAVYMLIAAGLLVIFVVSLGITRSRAGVGLGVAAILASALLLWFSNTVPTIVPILLIAGLLIGGGLVSAFALEPLMQRFAGTVAPEARLSILPPALAALKAYWPVGSGLGSFVPVFQNFEHADAFTSQFINHAHDDYLELLIETGLLGALIAVAGLIWIALASVRAAAWPAGRDRDLGRVAAVVVLLLLAHSVVDYPLRTAGLATVFGLACALLTPPPSVSEGSRRRRSSAPANDLPGARPVQLTARPSVTVRGRRS
jgi:O-antigen ligase